MLLRYFINKIILLALALSCTTLFAASNFNPQQTQAIEKIVHSYLVSHPQVLQQAYQALVKQKRQQLANLKTNRLKLIRQKRQQIFHDPVSPVVHRLKHPKAIVVEFYDYQCGHCRMDAPVINRLIKTMPNVRFVFKQYPIFGQHSVTAALAALAANRQGKFLAFHQEALMLTKTPLTEKEIYNTASKVGLDLKTLKRDMNYKPITLELLHNQALASQLHIDGTPAYILSNGSETKFVYVYGAIGLAYAQQELERLEKTDG